MSELLKVLGVFQVIAAGIFAYLAFQMPLTVGYGGNEVVNLQLMHNQSIWFLIAGVLIINGSLWLIGGALLDQLKDQTNRILRKEEPAPDPEIYA